MKKFIFTTGTRATDVWVGAGGAMLLKSKYLRTMTSDLDVGVDAREYNRLKSHPLCLGEQPIHGMPGEFLLSFPDEVDVHKEDRRFLKLESYCGILHWSMGDVLKLKLRLNRPKDIGDIAKLKSPKGNWL